MKIILPYKRDDRSTIYYTYNTYIHSHSYTRPHTNTHIHITNVRSKQNVQDKVGSLEDSDGNIITEGFLMAENLNEYFSSVFTREDISALPVPETKFEGRESDYLGQLIITPKMVAKKIRDMKDNKSPGVDGIPPKLLLEIVEQISIPLATVFNLALEEGVVPSEWKEANIIPLFKKGSRSKSENYRPVSLTSVI